MTAAPDLQPATLSSPDVAVGRWRVDPARSRTSFTARVAGRPLRGHPPVTGEGLATRSIEESAARLAANALIGPGFLDAGVFPQTSFRPQLLVRVPAGWQAVGQLQVKGGRARAGVPAGGGSGQPGPGRCQPVGAGRPVDNHPAGPGGLAVAMPRRARSCPTRSVSSGYWTSCGAGRQPAASTPRRLPGHLAKEDTNACTYWPGAACARS